MLSSLIYRIISDIHKALPLLNNTVIVEGHYLYYHYNQQEFTDKGWGCAYRSLQTLCSYFIMNHFYDMRIPTVIDVLILICHDCRSKVYLFRLVISQLPS